jgi:hypothetical protein
VNRVGWRERISHIRQHVTSSRDPVLVILKCHLLFEEQLERLIVAFLAKPSKFADLRLRFEQKLILAEALCAEVGTYRPAIAKLNTLRNKLAHSLKLVDMNSELSSVLLAADPDDFREAGVASATLAKKLGFLKQYTTIACSILEGIAEGAELARGRPAV